GKVTSATRATRTMTELQHAPECQHTSRLGRSLWFQGSWLAGLCLANYTIGNSTPSSMAKSLATMGALEGTLLFCSMYY
uniref:Uncharacterized protein n=1 Tax=Aegilops tauschii subsp. strangulata TaxID=200361 RepID=A0A453LK24_AEGTS